LSTVRLAGPRSTARGRCVVRSLRWLVVVALARAGMASADPPAPPAAPAVNLLTAVPTFVAVSSTVENPAILPSHLVDGKLDTAWNSRTGELVGAWIAVRLPADVHVDAIKLTVGFTKVDKKWGDLFTMNPRIKRVRVTHDNSVITDKVLDPELRTLQSIAIGKAGGDYRIEVLEVVPGTRKDWQEVNVSELEIWGAPGKSRAAKATPVVHIGGFDHDDLTRAQCLAALFDKPKGIKVTNYETFDLDNDRVVCRIDQPGEPQPTEGHTTPSTRVTVGVVKRAKLARIAKLPDFIAITPEGEPQMGMSQLGRTIVLGLVQLTTTETVLSVTDTEGESSMSYGKDNVTFQLFRIGPSSATNILQFNSFSSGSTNGGDSDRCTLVVPNVAAEVPAELEVNCIAKHEGYPGDPDHKDTEDARTDRYKWTGKIYDKVAAP
jgi:hypothetical protein